MLGSHAWFGCVLMPRSASSYGTLIRGPRIVYPPRVSSDRGSLVYPSHVLRLVRSCDDVKPCLGTCCEKIYPGFTETGSFPLILRLHTLCFYETSHVSEGGHTWEPGLGVLRMPQHFITHARVTCMVWRGSNVPKRFFLRNPDPRALDRLPPRLFSDRASPVYPSLVLILVRSCDDVKPCLGTCCDKIYPGFTETGSFPLILTFADTLFLGETSHVCEGGHTWEPGLEVLSMPPHFITHSRVTCMVWMCSDAPKRFFLRNPDPRASD